MERRLRSYIKWGAIYNLKRIRSYRKRLVIIGRSYEI
jgi:hypothetical protein